MIRNSPVNIQDHSISLVSAPGWHLLEHERFWLRGRGLQRAVLFDAVAFCDLPDDCLANMPHFAFRIVFDASANWVLEVQEDGLAHLEPFLHEPVVQVHGVNDGRLVLVKSGLGLRLFDGSDDSFLIWGSEAAFDAKHDANVVTVHAHEDFRERLRQLPGVPALPRSGQAAQDDDFLVQVSSSLLLYVLMLVG